MHISHNFAHIFYEINRFSSSDPTFLCLLFQWKCLSLCWDSNCNVRLRKVVWKSCSIKKRTVIYSLQKSTARHFRRAAKFYALGSILSFNLYVRFFFHFSPFFKIYEYSTVQIFLLFGKQIVVNSQIVMLKETSRWKTSEYGHNYLI